MEVYLNRIDGIDDAIISMYQSKRTITRGLEEEIRKTVGYYSKELFPSGALFAVEEDNAYKDMKDWLDKLFKWGTQHITLLKFIDLSFTVYGLHRAGQDDLDSHAKRMDNRIIRASTRLADFRSGEMSDYYKGKIVPTDIALDYLGIELPGEIEHDGVKCVRAVNGYIAAGMENNKDVKRGLYMLSIPSTFIFRINLAEFAHVYKERNKNGTANPEVKEAVERMADQLEAATLGYANRDLLLAIKN